MKEDLVLLDSTRSGIVVLTLNRPEVHNAFNAEVIERLDDLLEELKGADGVRAVFIEGAGSSFSAGGDIKWMRAAADYTHNDNLEDARALAQMLHKLYTLPHPTIALVDGAVRGGGVGVVAACDMALATVRAHFALSEVRLGMIPATISPYVIKAIGERAARRYFLTGEVFSAEEAKQLGLVHALARDKNELSTLSEPLVQALFESAPGAVAAAKDLIAHVAGRPIEHGLIADTAKRIADQRATAEAREGLSAFLDKRQPSWCQ